MNALINKNEKAPPKLVLVSVLSGSLTLLFSGVYICLTILGLIFRFNCNAFPSDSIPASGVFMNTIFRTYILDRSCDDSIILEGVTSDYSVFVLNAITLSFSAATAIAAIVLISALTSNSEIKYLNVIVIAYVALSICSLIVDLTFAAHFGTDYTLLTNKLDENPSSMLNSLRLGSMLLMTLCLKGLVFHFINVIFVILIVTYLSKFLMDRNKSAHSIHKLGVLQAYESSFRNGNHNSDSSQPFNRSRALSVVGSNGGSHLNYGFVNDDDPSRSRSPPRDNPRTDYTNFDRSNSWQPGNPSRPFTYLDEVRRPAPPRPPPSPSATSQWHQPWQPPVPAPDYSPHSPRRLKPALKSYM